MVALPLSIAIAIASGAEPAAGLVTAIIGGFLISALGGSRVQIGGPTGAFIVVAIWEWGSFHGGWIERLA
jgi:SulP family sulfate permease